MATSKMMQSLQATLSGLKDEHSTLGQAVEKMEELLAALTGGTVAVGKRRGRPPGSGKKAARRGRPPGSGKKAARRGRPPGSGKKAKAEKKIGKKAGRRNWTPEQKKAAAERMKAYWANKKE